MKDTLNILIVGKGGREAALADKIASSPRCSSLHITPGIHEGARCPGIPALDFEGLARYVADEKIDLVMVGPELPIISGIREALDATGAKVIAPGSECARLEGSKEFAKEFMARHAIPTPRFMTVTAETLEEGLSFLDSLQPPYVVKADGPAAGKGVFISSSLAEAKDMLHEMLDGLFGDSSKTVVLEQFEEGRECSVILALDGDDYQLLPPARDYKRLEEGDAGLNTAGVGGYSPVDFADEEFLAKVKRNIIEPTLRGLREEEMDYCGFLYLGLKDVGGEPVLLEYNVRLGDPETQVTLPLIESDFVDLLEGIADRTVALKKITVSPLSSVGVVLLSEGYPGFPRKGEPISGIGGARGAGCLVMKGNVAERPGGEVTDGGRVLTVVGIGATRPEAAARALEGAEMINYTGKRFRRDIGLD